MNNTDNPAASGGSAGDEAYLAELKKKADAGDRAAVKELMHLKAVAFSRTRLFGKHNATTGAEEK